MLLTKRELREGLMWGTLAMLLTAVIMLIVYFASGKIGVDVFGWSRWLDIVFVPVIVFLISIAIIRSVSAFENSYYGWSDMPFIFYFILSAFGLIHGGIKGFSIGLIEQAGLVFLFVGIPLIVKCIIKGVSWLREKFVLQDEEGGY
jgi:hypothetical protein